MLSFFYMISLQKSVLASSASADFISEEIGLASGNLSALQHDIAPAWVSSPQVRGTSDILWSCVVTLTACFYTAIHLNVPHFHETTWHFLWRKVKWVALALFAPELVLYTACVQFAEARTLIRKLNGIHPGNEHGASTGESENEESTIHVIDSGTHVSDASNCVPDTNATAPDNVPHYDLRYGFFVVMGGCITKDVEKISDKHTQVTITAQGAIALAREGFFIDTSSKRIADKSKANLFGKGLVCAQVTWFITQCIARAIASYSLLLIEIHTMVHVACALATYALWWQVSDYHIVGADI